MKLSKKIFCLFVIFFILQNAFTQTKKPAITLDSAAFKQGASKHIKIASVLIFGNSKTKSSVIQREIPFTIGDTFSVTLLIKKLNLAKTQIYNTTLFDDVTFKTIIDSNGNANVLLNLKERWYIYPVPVFKWVDRNFNEWYKTYNHNFNRVNYGIKFVHYNATGHRDQLQLFLINGYTKNISIAYNNPYMGKKLNNGFSFGLSYSQNREMAYKTSVLNKILLFKKPDFVKYIFSANAGFSKRQGLYSRHNWSVTYNQISINESIISLTYNPHYFNQNKSINNFVDVAYFFQFAKVNNTSYPLKGKTFYFGLFKRGFGISGNINLLQLDIGGAKYFDLKNNWFVDVQASAKIKLPFEQAYINQKALGYGGVYLRGLEYYVVDGVASSLIKSTLKKKILYCSIPFPFKSKKIDKIPFTFFAKSYVDLGYAYNKPTYQTHLNNQLLYTGGFGIDLLTLYDINLRIEYSINQMGEKGMFYHSQ